MYVLERERESVCRGTALSNSILLCCHLEKVLSHVLSSCPLRHLVFCIFDLLLEFMFPEIPEMDFQRSLLQTLSKNPEKWLA